MAGNPDDWGDEVDPPPPQSGHLNLNKRGSRGDAIPLDDQGSEPLAVQLDGIDAEVEQDRPELPIDHHRVPAGEELGDHSVAGGVGCEEWSLVGLNRDTVTHEALRENGIWDLSEVAERSGERGDEDQLSASSGDASPTRCCRRGSP